jgi:hypothetical protein
MAVESDMPKILEAARKAEVGDENRTGSESGLSKAKD